MGWEVGWGWGWGAFAGRTMLLLPPSTPDAPACPHHNSHGIHAAPLPRTALRPAPAQESEYAAWVLVHGYALNHATIAG